MDIVTLQIAKQYTKDSIQGAGALKGEKGDPGPGLPPGGAVGQIPAKRSAVDYDVEWIDLPTGGGGSGGGGNPVGTIISFLGTTAPAGYVICDGTEYGVSKYPALAAFFEAQFGAANYFGGDGETTFAVPDMRNLFLRGYHGEAEEQLSGEVGERQEATEHLNTFSTGASAGFELYWVKNLKTESVIVQNPDKRINAATAGHTARSVEDWPVVSPNEGKVGFKSYTSRPVNMAVLYCIKAV